MVTEQEVAVLSQEELAAIMNGLEDGNGDVRPDYVVEAARQPDSPLHPFFEWDDSVAAYEYRLNQARALIRSVRVDIKTSTTIVRAVAYVRSPAAAVDEQGYRAIARVLTDEEHKKKVLMDEAARVRGLIARLRTMGRVFELSDYVESVIADLL